MTDITYINVFAGSGGFSEGYVRQGFKPVAHVELDPSACFTLKTRIAYHYLSGNGQENIYNAYLKGDIERNQLYSYVPEELLNTVINAEVGRENDHIFESIDNLLKGESVDLIIGGPPCQAYAVVGRAPLKHKKDDPRTKLYIHYGRFLKKYQPKLFVFENVPGILSSAKGQYFKNLKKYFRRLGYQVEARIHNAYDYGVVQNRVRVIIIGWKKKDFYYPEFKTDSKKHYRDDIFSDLPPIKPNEKQRIQPYLNGTNEYLKNSFIREDKTFVSQHITRFHNQRDLKIYKLAIERLQQGIKLMNNEIPEGIRTQKNIKDFLDRFKVVDKEPHTMIAHIAKDGHHFIHPDIKQLRSISVREAARIQSFPDNYYFEGVTLNSPITPAFRQIGNAVPPLMAEKIAKKIKEMFAKEY